MKNLILSVRHRVYLFVCNIPGGEHVIGAIFGFLAWRQRLQMRKTMRKYGVAACEEVYKSLGKAGITHWADHGTLLGIIRENGLISHDLDIDYSVPEDVDFSDVYYNLSESGFVLKHGFTYQGQIVEITMSWHGVSVDFFKCHQIDKRMGNFVFVLTCDKRIWKIVDVMAHERVRPAITGVSLRSFGNGGVAHAYIPKNAEEILSAEYGSWKIPDKKTDFCARDVPSHYRDIHDECAFLQANELRQVLVR